ncbi:MAG: alpha-amylase family glycosyl hydrolase [Candidatus Flexifilum sp.]
MKHWPDKLVIYEVNTWVWLNQLSAQYHTPITLANVPDEALDRLALPGVDMIWLMGVWKRSPFSRQHALKWQHQYRPALPDLTEDDVIGSAYAIADYQVDERIGGRRGLAVFRLRLRERGVRLMLDFVPNHVATDHPWTDNLELVIRGRPEDAIERPSDFFIKRDSHGREIVLAHGRDPYFPGWADTAQLNAFSPALRRTVVQQLQDIAAQCDGVRCDMAMLMMNSIFAGTWNGYVGPPPATDFWTEIIPPIKRAHPDFLFIAEVYWNMEYALLQQGFDFAYDKVLYDRIISGDVYKLRQHLVASLDYQKQMLRFIENHDEPRAMASLGEKRVYPAATLVCTLPGGLLLHEGQLEGRRVKLPVQIARAPQEKPDHSLEAYYLRLLRETRDPVYQQGQFYLFDVMSVGGDDRSNHNLIAYGWFREGDYRLIVVNLTGQRSYGRINLTPFKGVDGKAWRLNDITDGAHYYRSGAEMTRDGLFVALDAYESHVFHFEPAPATATISGMHKAVTKAIAATQTGERQISAR